MSVLINDFEVLPEPPGDDPEDQENQAAPPERPSLEAHDVLEIVRRRKRRRRRLRAH